MPITVTFRIIQSFEFQTVFYMQQSLELEFTLLQVQELINKEIQANNKFKPSRGKLQKFNMFKEFTRPGIAKTGELCIQQKGEEWPILENGNQTLSQVNWEHGIEISYYVKSERI
ncbi:hypothetical protein SS50377_23118 [Spironucleus salmonicida]|uniref:Uncharacterized protein n=1 Tax=Spironucleus salmonicida TaxID=348837 RepID=V6LBD0_9EUKA|nr:hypothetical protein SS50377_23118 [Spironucleus salmonicida]|eukprot:EST41707.1 Hypothetical protein SS50377_18794 [Spironucleus salmonicida]